eukprot:CAMPEP_0171070338 /NCGR_PEP_ID=MMETSP0766_2-20121228/9685_1 /TAXON_ID=439317 /ORGANISM="Gambierdiscus australes, Strain CAWD 149" /LENGTH=110 /DNA_ID=CAMNT_0011526801 /DNA_START=282 /DNA_END=611 /DNA_ORIENTATION=-
MPSRPRHLQAPRPGVAAAAFSSLAESLAFATATWGQRGSGTECEHRVVGSRAASDSGHRGRPVHRGRAPSAQFTEGVECCVMAHTSSVEPSSKKGQANSLQPPLPKMRVL